MKTIFSKFEWVLWLITLIPSLAVFWLWEQIPPTIPTHYNLIGTADAWGSKNLLLWIIPTMTLFMYFLLLFIPLIDPKKRIENMGKKYFALRLILLLIISSISFLWVYTSANSQIGFTAALFPVLAVFLIIMGNYLQTIKPNYFIGIRTPWTLQSEQNWLKTHRLGSRVYMIGGVILLIATLFGFKSAFLLALLGMLLLPFFYSFWLYVRDLKKQS